MNWLRLAWAVAPAALVGALLLIVAHAEPASTAPDAQAPQTQTLELVGQVGGALSGIAVRGTTVYLGSGPRLLILDASDPAAPRQVGRSPVLPGLVRTVAVSGTHAYVGIEGNSIRVLDVGSPARVTEVATVAVSTTPEIAVSGHHLYLAAGSAGLRVLDVTDPRNPVEVATFDTPRDAGSVAVDACGNAYVADTLGGLFVLRLGPTASSPSPTAALSRPLSHTLNFPVVPMGWCAP